MYTVGPVIYGPPVVATPDNSREFCIFCTRL